jgi:hypothetical protein
MNRKILCKKENSKSNYCASSSNAKIIAGYKTVKLLTFKVKQDYSMFNSLTLNEAFLMFKSVKLYIKNVPSIIA